MEDKEQSLIQLEESWKSIKAQLEQQKSEKEGDYYQDTTELLKKMTNIQQQSLGLVQGTLQELSIEMATIRNSFSNEEPSREHTRKRKIKVSEK